MILFLVLFRWWMGKRIFVIFWWFFVLFMILFLGIIVWDFLWRSCLKWYFVIFLLILFFYLMIFMVFREKILFWVFVLCWFLYYDLLSFCCFCWLRKWILRFWVLSWIFYRFWMFVVLCMDRRSWRIFFLVFGFLFVERCFRW